MKVTLSEEDQKRLYREVKLTLYDINKLVQSVKDTRSFFFQRGDQEKVQYLNDLIERLEKFYEKS